MTACCCWAPSRAPSSAPCFCCTQQAEVPGGPGFPGGLSSAPAVLHCIFLPKCRRRPNTKTQVPNKIEYPGKEGIQRHRSWQVSSGSRAGKAVDGHPCPRQHGCIASFRTYVLKLLPRDTRYICCWPGTPGIPTEKAAAILLGPGRQRGGEEGAHEQQLQRSKREEGVELVCDGRLLAEVLMLEKLNRK